MCQSDPKKSRSRQTSFSRRRRKVGDKLVGVKLKIFENKTAMRTILLFGLQTSLNHQRKDGCRTQLNVKICPNTTSASGRPLATAIGLFNWVTCTAELSLSGAMELEEPGG